MYPERSKPQPQLHFAFTDDRSTISFSTRLLPQVKSPPPARLDFGFLFGVTFALVTLRSRVAWHYYHVYMYTGDTVVWEIETTPAGRRHSTSPEHPSKEQLVLSEPPAIYALGTGVGAATATG